MSILIRPGHRGDRSYVYATFVNGYERSHYATGASPETLAGLLQALILDREWGVAVACPPEDHGAIVGWIIHRPETKERDPALGWMHVRGAFRRRGVGRALLEHAGVRIGTAQQVPCAFLTPDAAKEAARHGVILRFRPYLALEAAVAGLKAPAPDGEAK